MRQWGAGAGGKDAVSVDDLFLRMVMGWTLDGERVHSTVGAPQATATINDYSLGSTPVNLLRFYPAAAAVITLVGVVPQRAGQILLVSNDNNLDDDNLIAVSNEGAFGASVAQNTFASTVAYNAGTPVVNNLAIPGGNIAAFRYFGPIGASGRWRELWASAGCGRLALG